MKMQAKIHMQDQITNRIDLIMQDKRNGYLLTEKTSMLEWCKRITGDIATIGIVMLILMVGSGW